VRDANLDEQEGPTPDQAKQQQDGPLAAAHGAIDHDRSMRRRQWSCVPSLAVKGRWSHAML
jgi:hypothetical protein